MMQKQVIGVTLGVIVVVTVSFFVYRQFAAPTATDTGVSVPKHMVDTKNAVVTTPSKMKEADASQQAVPSSIDGIAAAIEDETTLDTAALDNEESGELLEINADKDSVNSLSTSYDENSL